MVTHNRLSPLVSAIVFACAASAHADIVGYTDFDEWSAATGEFTTIDFAGWPEATVITDQYSESGVTFIDGNDWIWNAGEGTFPNDGSGLHGN